jgi:hypothetical protein
MALAWVLLIAQMKLRRLAPLTLVELVILEDAMSSAKLNAAGGGSTNASVHQNNAQTKQANALTNMT